MYRPVWEVKARRGVWAVQRRGADRADSLHVERADAIARGYELAERYQGRIRVRDRSGAIEIDESYAAVES